jgi:hypothetical protein
MLAIRVSSFILILSVSSLWNNCLGQFIPHEDPLIEKTIDSNRTYRNDHPGFRIQLAFDTDKLLIDSLRLVFVGLCPKQDAYIAFEAPYFNLMAGDFRTEIEAEVLRKELLGLFPLTIIQRARIKLPRID